MTSSTRFCLRLAFAATTLIAAVGCGRTAPQATDLQRTEPPAVEGASAPILPGEVEVDLRDQAVAREQIDILINNRSLRRLRLSGSDIDDVAISRIAAGCRLELLDVVGCPRLTPAALQSIGSIQTLRNLRLSGPAVDDESIAHLAGLSELAAILLQQTDVSDRGIAVLAQLPKLREVNLFGTAGVTDDALVVLAKLPALEKLRLRATGVTGEDAAALSRMRTVTELDLSETAFDNSGMPAVAAMPALEQLNLWLTQVDDAGMEQLRTQTKLTSLNLDNVSAITDESLAVIENMQGLTFLHLGGTSVTADGLQRLKSLTQLRTLIITRLGLSPQQAETIRQAMPWVNRIEV